MDHLSKHQLILVALLVSFVTALATGVVTVSLVNQAPASVTQTISRVIERTIDAAAPQSGAAATAADSALDPVADAIAAVASSTVTIRNADNGSILGNGLIVSAQGMILSDKSVVSGSGRYIATMSGFTAVPVAVVQSQVNGDIVFLSPITPETVPQEYKQAILFNVSPRLGQAVFSLTGADASVLRQGLITALPALSTSSERDVVTSVDTSGLPAGTPLFDISGKIVGVRTSSYFAKGPGIFYGIAPAAAAVPTGT